MKRLLPVAVFVALAAMIVFVTAGTALAGPGAAPACATTATTPAFPPGSHLVEDITFHVINGEDAGTYGYWALDNDMVRVRVWQVSKVSTFGAPYGEFSALFQITDGRWQTFVGALSPNKGVPELADGSGTFSGCWSQTFAGVITPGQNMFGNMGIIDVGGSKSDIQLGTYELQTGNTNTTWDPITSYFTSPDQFADESVPYYWELYRYKCQTILYYGVNNAINTYGDIVIK